MQTLKKRREFQRVQKSRKRVTPAFVLYRATRAGEDVSSGPRFGFTVSKSAVARPGVAKKRGLATDRNRARRRLREAVRLCLDAACADSDYVVIGRTAALTRDFAAMLTDLRLALENLKSPNYRADPGPARQRGQSAGTSL